MLCCGSIVLVAKHRCNDGGRYTQKLQLGGGGGLGGQLHGIAVGIVEGAVFDGHVAGSADGALAVAVEGAVGAGDAGVLAGANTKKYTATAIAATATNAIINIIVLLSFYTLNHLLTFFLAISYCIFTFS